MLSFAPLLLCTAMFRKPNMHWLHSSSHSKYSSSKGKVFLSKLSLKINNVTKWIWARDKEIVWIQVMTHLLILCR
jgi:hypothetical protein